MKDQIADRPGQAWRNSPKLYWLIAAAPPFFGGGERHLQLVGKFLRQRAGWEVEVLTVGCRGLPVREQAPFGRVHRFGDRRSDAGKRRGLLEAAAFLRMRLRQEDVLYVHLSTNRLYGGADYCAGVLRIAAERGCPYVIRATSTGRISEFLEACEDGEELLRGAGKIVALNPVIASELRSAGVAHDRIAPQLNAVDIEPVRTADRHAVRRELGVKDARILTFAGRFARKKRIPDLVDAWKKARSIVPEQDVRLWLVGSREHLMKNGTGRDALALPRTDSEDSSIYTISPQPFENLARIYAASDGFVNFSEREGLSNALVESMSSGLAAIVADLPENTHVLSPENREFLFRPGRPDSELAALRHFLTVPAGHLRWVGERNRAASKTFDIETVGPAYTRLFNNVRKKP